MLICGPITVTTAGANKLAKEKTPYIIPRLGEKKHLHILNTSRT